jgi:dUTP pyrophosphatase
MIKVILFNFSNRAFTVTRGDRIAQLVFNKVVRVVFTPVDSLSDTERGSGGFGHTGSSS